MTTEMKRFTEAYATMTVAAYEPLILHWISLIGIKFVSNAVAYRLPKAQAVNFDGKTPAALVLGKTVAKALPTKINYQFANQDLQVPIDIHGRAIDPATVTKLDVGGYPNAVAVGKDVYLNGLSETDPAARPIQRRGFGLLSRFVSNVGSFTQGLKTIPISVSGRLGTQQPGFDFIGTRDTIQQNLVKAAREWVLEPATKDFMQLMTAGTNVAGIKLPHMWPGVSAFTRRCRRSASHIIYRQLYFNKEEGVGPIEEAFTVAPLETLEVIYQTVRKQIHEEILEQGLEVVSESAVEEKNLDEVSDKVSSMVQQDVSASMSANASGGIGVWQVGASASASFGVSSQRSREYSTRRLKEVTKRASERITKSFSIKTTRHDRGHRDDARRGA